MPVCSVSLEGWAVRLLRGGFEALGGGGAEGTVRQVFLGGAGWKPRWLGKGDSPLRPAGGRGNCCSQTSGVNLCEV